LFEQDGKALLQLTHEMLSGPLPAERFAGGGGCLAATALLRYFNPY